MEIPKPRLKRRSAVPYNGSYDLNLKEQGLVGSGTTFDMLLTNIIAYRKANGLEIGLGLEDMIEQALCTGKYSHECEQRDAAAPDPAKRIGWRTVLAGTKVMLRHWLAGKPLESQAEAERRAEICSRCPWNLDISWSCGGPCAEFKDFVERQVGAPKTKYDDRLRNCGICSCYLSSAIFVPLDMQYSVLTEEQKKQFAIAHAKFGCWKFKDESSH